MSVILALLPTLVLAVSSEPVVILLEGQRREIQPVLHGEVELLPIESVIDGLGVSVRSDPGSGAVTLSCQGREAALYHRKSLVSIGGDLRLLSSPVLFEDGHWLVPMDGVPRLLGPLLARRVDWRPASRILVVGNVSIPKVGATSFVSGDSVRVVLQASEKVPFRVFQEEKRVTISVLRDIIDVPFTQERLTGGIIDLVQFVGGKENLFAITLGRRFHQLKAYEQEGPPRLVLEFHALPLTVRSERPVPKPTPVNTEGAQVRIVVLDPGHGGDEGGAIGPGGTIEKDVTLAIARKLRSAIANSLGHQVFLTRDRDVEIPLDERTAVANNYKADIFISIHANASRTQGATGSEVYFLSYQASDEESRRIALAEGTANPPNGAAAPGADLAFILWDMAQAEHLEESSALASRIQEELAGVTGAEGRGVKQAPFRILVGAAMPAVLVETAFISNPEEEKRLASDAYQNTLVAALLKGIARYEADRAQRVGLTGRTQRPGS